MSGVHESGTGQDATASATFEQVILEHQRVVYAVCYAKLRDPYAAEDATQETFIAAWRQAPKVRGPVRPWLMRIATNKSNDELRRRQRAAKKSGVVIGVDSIEAASEEPGPESAVLNDELRHSLAGALATLPAAQRETVLLSDVQGRRYQEVALVTRVSVGTVKSRIHRAHARLRQALARAS